MSPMKVTEVRLSEEQGHEALQKFIFGGHYGPIRVPRGIEPELASRFIRMKCNQESDDEELGKAHEVMLFYERADVVDHFAPFIVGPPADADAFRLQAVVCQMFGDLGQPAEVQNAAAHCQRFLISHAEAIPSKDLLQDALLALAPVGSVDPYAAAIDADLARLAPNQNRDEASMMAYDKVASIQRNDLPRLRLLIDLKTRLAAKELADRRTVLVDLYLGRERVNHASLQVWAARQLRLEGMATGPEPTQLAFGKVFDSIDQELLGKEKAADVLAQRSARAFRYFGGVLTEPQQRKLDLAQTATLDFLDDGI